MKKLALAFAFLAGCEVAEDVDTGDFGFETETREVLDREVSSARASVPCVVTVLDGYVHCAGGCSTEMTLWCMDNAFPPSP